VKRSEILGLPLKKPEISFPWTVRDLMVFLAQTSDIDSRVEGGGHEGGGGHGGGGHR
jgi:hypothetical protein